MRYPKYKYTVLTKNNYWNDGPIKLTNLPDQYGGQAYAHVMQYDKSIVAHYDIGKKPPDYYGTRYTENVVLDIDLKGDVAEARNLSVAFVESLIEQYEIESNWLQYFFSGMKGFHILIPSILFNISPHNQLEGLLKHLVKKLTADHPIERAVDDTFYCRNRWVRLPNSRHPNTGFYKIPLSYSELTQISTQEVYEIAKAPRWIEALEPFELSPNPLLSEFYQEILTIGTGGNSINTADLLERGVDEGERGKNAFLIARGLRDQGSSKNEAKSILLDWNNQNNPPIKESGWADSLVRSTYNNHFTKHKDSVSPKLQALLRNHPIFRTGLLSEVQYRCAVTLLSLTNTRDNIWQSIPVKVGQFITSQPELGRKANIQGKEGPETAARNTLEKLIKAGVLVKILQMPKNKGSLYEWRGDFAEVFLKVKDHPPKSLPQITPYTAPTTSVSVKYDDNLENLITPIDHLFMSSTKKVPPYEHEIFNHQKGIA